MKSFRVAVAGAGGIGRHHAKWHARAGSDVVAILGQRPERLPGTARILSELFGFHGRVYCDFGDLLGHEQPDIVDICAPNGAHYDLACQALDAGCHVLCEKPLVWGSSTDESLTQAEDLRQRAQHAGVHLGMCSQYAASLPQYRRLFRSLDLPASTSFSAEMETLSSHQPRDARAIWIDMGPHPLSLLLAVWPSATLLEESLQVRFAGRTAEASFTVRVVTARSQFATEIAGHSHAASPLMDILSISPGVEAMTVYIAPSWSPAIPKTWATISCSC